MEMVKMQFSRHFGKEELLRWIPLFFDGDNGEFMQGFVCEQEVYTEEHHRFPSGLKIYNLSKVGNAEYGCDEICFDGAWHDRDSLTEAVLKKEDWSERGEQVDIYYYIDEEKLKDEDEDEGVNQ